MKPLVYNMEDCQIKKKGEMEAMLVFAQPLVLGIFKKHSAIKTTSCCHLHLHLDLLLNGVGPSNYKAGSGASLVDDLERNPISLVDDLERKDTKDLRLSWGIIGLTMINEFEHPLPCLRMLVASGYDIFWKPINLIKLVSK